ncbi:hypothetical protein MMC13_001610 [Lambiella insularis]|nr:hypothetical protein [Lambiella insularis]
MAYVAPRYNQWGSLMSGGSGVVIALTAIGTLTTNIASLVHSTSSSASRAKLWRLQDEVQRLREEVERGMVDLAEVQKRIEYIERELWRML